jgi:DNA-binding CsgD family transcriptional regulator
VYFARSIYIPIPVLGFYEAKMPKIYVGRLQLPHWTGITHLGDATSSPHTGTRTHAGSLEINVGFDETMVRAYKELLAKRNIWLRSGAHLLTTHQVRTSHMMCYQIPQRPEATMSRMYGLTPAEAKVAALIARGLSGRQAADKLEVGYNTLKTHLRRVFVKTDTNNQGALIRLMVAGAGRVDFPAGGPQQDRRLHPRT